jgi:hypothetical protein
MGPAPRVDQRRPMAVFGGLLAGIGIGIALASVFHIIEQASPNGFGSGIGGTVALVVLLAGPAIGLGLGMMAAALIPDGTPPDNRPPSSG